MVFQLFWFYKYQLQIFHERPKRHFIRENFLRKILMDRFSCVEVLIIQETKNCSCHWLVWTPLVRSFHIYQLEFFYPTKNWKNCFCKKTISLNNCVCFTGVRNLKVRKNWKKINIVTFSAFMNCCIYLVAFFQQIVYQNSLLGQKFAESVLSIFNQAFLHIIDGKKVVQQLLLFSIFPRSFITLLYGSCPKQRISIPWKIFDNID